MCRPGVAQQIMYNGHKRVHAIKFEQVLAANGLIVRMFGPVGKLCVWNLFILHFLYLTFKCNSYLLFIEGKRLDAGLLRISGLYQDLERYSWAPDCTALCIYGTQPIP